MPKKLIRIHSPKAQDLIKYLGKDMNIVLKNGIVYFGVLTKLDKEQFFFSDKINNKHVKSLNELEEIVIDEIHQF